MPPEESSPEPAPLAVPVIEQAKGVVMATYHCGPEEAFDLLRKASQQANVKVQVIAEQLIEKASRGVTII